VYSGGYRPATTVVGLQMLRESAGILESLAAGPARVVTPTRLLVHCQLMLLQVHLKGTVSRDF
jgi:hypothetical protein